MTISNEHYHQLITKIEQQIQLSFEDKVAVQGAFQYQTATKNTVLQAAFSIPNYLYFVLEGYVRLYYINERGDEVTTRISGPNDFITPFLQFIHQRPSKRATVCISDCQLLAISGEQLRQLIFQNPRFQEFSLIIFEQAIERIEERADDLATLDAEQRYRKFLLAYPNSLEQIPLMYIASFLGMKPESLSRIRKKLQL